MPIPANAQRTSDEECVASVRRFTSGPGRRPGATVVPVTLRLQVLNAEGKFVEASADRTRATVSGNDITLKAIVNNTSLYDIGNVVITHSFKKPFSGSPTLESIESVSGAFYNERINSFVIDTIPSDTAITFTFHLLLSGDINGGLAQSQIKLEDFEVLEAERRLPERTPETPSGRSTQTVERVGIGGTDVACFTGDGVVRFLPSTNTSGTSGGSSTTTSSRTTSIAQPPRKIPGPPYLIQTGTLQAQYVPPTSSSSSSVSLGTSPSSISPSSSSSSVSSVSQAPPATVRIGTAASATPGSAMPLLMPRTGVDLWMFTLGGNILLGVLITIVLFALSLSSARFISRKWLGGGEGVE